MTDKNFDVVGIGNAIVDVISTSNETFLEEQELPKGGMTLVDAERARRLYAATGPTTEMSGGSAANTLAGLASLGGQGGFIGKVRDDQLGEIFRHDIRSTGIAFTTLPAEEGAPTGRCLVFVTPDAQRTMATHLGISVTLGPEDLNHELIAEARVLYLEGYLWDAEAAKQAFLEAVETAKANNTKVALSLSDPFCVERHRDSFLELIADHVDLLFANEQEAKSLYLCVSLEEALAQLQDHCATAVVTRSAAGSLILQDGNRFEVPAEALGEVVDSTGAGDLYAAGFLYGYTRGYPPSTSGRIGALAAGEVISHVGPRPQQSLGALLAARTLDI
ncbi:MAG: adenosine kinase [Pseudomonadota bacterium]|uniref:adenosine kinase n=1 Tax=Fodinicurvata sediminis TaxID=1121832 RepID=UPI0003B74622|nr:adenosine kinase [Fodinicurvata sediminis]